MVTILDLAWDYKHRFLEVHHLLKRNTDKKHLCRVFSKGKQVGAFNLFMKQFPMKAAEKHYDQELAYDPKLQDQKSLTEAIDYFLTQTGEYYRKLRDMNTDAKATFDYSWSHELAESEEL